MTTSIIISGARGTSKFEYIGESPDKAINNIIRAISCDWAPVESTICGPMQIDHDRDGDYERCTKCNQSWPKGCESACVTALHQLKRAGGV